MTSGSSFEASLLMTAFYVEAWALTGSRTTDVSFLSALTSANSPGYFSDCCHKVGRSTTWESCFRLSAASVLYDVELHPISETSDTRSSACASGHLARSPRRLAYGAARSRRQNPSSIFVLTKVILMLLIHLISSYLFLLDGKCYSSCSFNFDL